MTKILHLGHLLCIWLRSTIFWALLILNTLICGIIFLPTLLTNNVKIIAYIGKLWSIISLYLLRAVCGLSYKVNGESRTKGSFIIAARHESVWETIFFLQHFNLPAFILKKELCSIPIYGWYLKPMGMIPINRSAKVSANRQIQQGINKAIERNQPIAIFPHGTRVQYNMKVDIKSGIYMLHQTAPQLPIIPCTLDSGKYWPKNSYLIYPGSISVTFYPDINLKKALWEKHLLLDLLNRYLNP